MIYKIYTGHNITETLIDLVINNIFCRKLDIDFFL